MTSPQKIQANRLNSRKSSGPRTISGRWKAARNSLKHGLASIRQDAPSDCAYIEHLVEAYCGTEPDPKVRMQARLVAQSELVLRVVRQRQVDAIERRLAAGAKWATTEIVLNEHDAIQAAAPDLKRLERYERRAWSRLKRAMRDLIDLKCGHIQA
jgi:hypothetical protein